MLTAIGTGSALVAGPVPHIQRSQVQQMQRIKIIRATVCGGVAVEPGAIVEANDRDAHVLLSLGKAVPADQEAAQDAPGATDGDDWTEGEGQGEATAAPRRRGRPPKAAQ